MATRRKTGKPAQARTRRRKGARRVPRVESAGAQERVLSALARVFKRLEQPAAVIGGVAVIAWGHARLTSDVDCAIASPPEEIGTILNEFEREGFSPRVEDAEAFARDNLVLLLQHDETGIGVDASLAQLGFEHAALRSSVLRPFGSVKVRVPQLTDLFIYKLVAGRPKDLQDVEELVALAAEVEIDATRIEATLSEFDALLETNRLGEWQRLWRSR